MDGGPEGSSDDKCDFFLFDVWADQLSGSYNGCRCDKTKIVATDAYFAASDKKDLGRLLDLTFALLHTPPPTP